MLILILVVSALDLLLYYHASPVFAVLLFSLITLKCLWHHSV